MKNKLVIAIGPLTKDDIGDAIQRSKYKEEYKEAKMSKLFYSFEVLYHDCGSKQICL